MSQSSEAIYGQDLSSPLTSDLTRSGVSAQASSPAIAGQDLTSAQTYDLTQPQSSAARGVELGAEPPPGPASRLQPDIAAWLADPHPRRRALRLGLALAMGTDEGLLQLKYGWGGVRRWR